MKVKRRWYELFLPCLAVLLVLAAGTVQTSAADEYVEDTDVDGDKYEYGDETNAAWTANEETGYCTCSVNTNTWSSGDDIAYASANSYGMYTIDWTWNGPPGEAPGGTLDWSLDSEGFAYAHGQTNAVSGNALSYGSADSKGALGSNDGSAYGKIEVWGSVENSQNGSVGASGSGVPEDDYYVYPDPPTGWGRTPPGGYFIFASYAIDTSDSAAIAIDTSHVLVLGFADCDNASICSTIGNSAAMAETIADADASVYGSFSSN